MFFDDSLKGLKKELKTAGGNISFVKEWQKTYDKVKKQSVSLKGQYIKVIGELESVMAHLKKMEEILIAQNTETDYVSVKDQLCDFVKDLKNYQNDFNYEFLISKEDKEFHLTYTTIISLCEKNMSNPQEALILQSEVENLMSMTKEALDKRLPDYREMAYFYIGHSDCEIFELPHQEKLQLVQRIYMDEFYNPMKQIVETALGVERAKQIMEVDLWI